jgi:competence protein ComEC
VSCGAQNRFGFPSPEVVTRYAKNGIRLLRTDIHGQVSISSNGHHLTIAPLIPIDYWRPVD